MRRIFRTCRGLRANKALLLVAAIILMGACARSNHQPSFGWMLETHFPSGIPAEQQDALDDHVITTAEMEKAAAARDACIAALPGVDWVEPFAWVDSVNFTGGAYQTDSSVDEGELGTAADACYYRYVALIETAWLDQQYFGDWSNENLLGDRDGLRPQSAAVPLELTQPDLLQIGRR